MTIAKLNQEVADLRDNARLIAQRTYRGMVLRSCGTVLFGILPDGNRTDDTWEIKRLTLKVIKEFADEYPTVTEIYAGGGYDAHATVEWDENYEPWVSEWDCIIWSEKSGIQFTDSSSYFDSTKPRY